MRTRILITGLALVTAMSFGQKKEIKKAEKAVKSNKYSEALSYINEAESQLGAADNTLKSEFYAVKGQAILGTAGQDFSKLKSAAEAFSEAISLNDKIRPEIEVPMQNLRASLVNGAIKDQNAGKFADAADKLYTSYKMYGEPSDLYFAAGNAVNEKDYDRALQYYQMLLDSGYTGEISEFVATNKSTGEVQSFENENIRNIAVRTGEFIKPEIQVTESRKGEILRNMTLMYVEKGNTEKATALMKSARAENPKDVNLMRVEADMSYNMGNKERYNELMKEIIATDPDNPEIYFNLGVSNDQLGNKEEALSNYTKALELDPNYELALINIAALKLSDEEKIVDEMNSLGTSAADNKKYDELRKKRESIYKEVLPYLEKAYAINPSNQNVVTYLMNLYGQIGEDAKFQEMKAKLTELESKQ
ncbi:MAG: tetratricopeptide repeat protein [Aequorivita sp.]